jgi:hypothetical protein
MRLHENVRLFINNLNLKEMSKLKEPAIAMFISRIREWDLLPNGTQNIN